MVDFRSTQTDKQRDGEKSNCRWRPKQKVWRVWWSDSDMKRKSEKEVNKKELNVTFHLPKAVVADDQDEEMKVIW